MLGPLLALAAAFCWGTSSIFVRLGLQHIKTNIGVFISIAASLALVVLLFVSVDLKSLSAITPAVILWFSLIGFLNYVIGRQCNYLGVKNIGVARATCIYSSNPLFAMILAVLLTGETVNLVIVLGAVAIIGGLLLVITGR